MFADIATVVGKKQQDSLAINLNLVGWSGTECGNTHVHKDLEKMPSLIFNSRLSFFVCKKRSRNTLPEMFYQDTSLGQDISHPTLTGPKCVGFHCSR